MTTDSFAITHRHDPGNRSRTNQEGKVSMKKPAMKLLTLTAVSALLLAACGSGSTTGSSTASGGASAGSKSSDVSIGLALSTLKANQVQNFQTQKLSGVIINAVDSDAAGPIVAPLIAAKTPVVAVDRAVNGATVDSFIASDNVAGGALAADALAKAIGDKGKVIVLQGVAGTSASRDRGKGFTDGIKKHPNIQVVATQPADFDRTKGLDVATNLLQAQPDAVGIFAENDEMALGAIQALGDRAGKSVFVVGFDGTADGVAAIKAGTMAASIAQQPEELGKSAVTTLLALIDGKTAEKTIGVPVVVLTKDNA
jgi:ribose transport system substrate-binding protein